MEHQTVTRAVIFVPRRDRYRWERVCVEDCETRGELVTGVVIGEWQGALAMVAAGSSDVIVVARREHIPPGGVPGVRVVQEDD